MNISEFKEGDVITMTEPTKDGEDKYIGLKMVFTTIANGCIYLKHSRMMGGMVTTFISLDEDVPNKSEEKSNVVEIEIKLPHYKYKEGWEPYVEVEAPKDIFKQIWEGISKQLGFEEVDKGELKPTSLQEQLEQALKNEDYESAKKIKDKMKHL